MVYETDQSEALSFHRDTVFECQKGKAVDDDNASIRTCRERRPSGTPRGVVGVGKPSA
jgi:hypothetical protein